MFSKESGAKNIIISVVCVNFAALFFLFSTAKKPKEVEFPGGSWVSEKEGEEGRSQTSLETTVPEGVSQEGVSQDEIDLVLQKFRKLHAVQSVEEARVAEKSEEGGQALEKRPVSPRQYVVLSGDTIESIAQQFQVQVQELVQYNALQTERVELGQVVLIPDKKNLASSGKCEEQQPEEVVYYVVKAGDSPWVIAHKHQIPVQKLLQLNDLDEKKSRRLKPGDKVRIR